MQVAAVGGVGGAVWEQRGEIGGGEEGWVRDEVIEVMKDGRHVGWGGKVGAVGNPSAALVPVAATTLI